MTTVYVVWHGYEPTPQVDADRFIGIYSTEQNAERAVLRMRNKPGFAEFPEGFEITQSVLDRESWIDGFGPD